MKFLDYCKYVILELWRGSSFDEAKIYAECLVYGFKKKEKKWKI